MRIPHLDEVGHAGGGDGGVGVTTTQDNCGYVVRLPIAMCVSNVSEPLI